MLPASLPLAGLFLASLEDRCIKSTDVEELACLAYIIICSIISILSVHSTEYSPSVKLGSSFR